MVYLHLTSQRPVRTRISEIHLTVEIAKGQSQNRTSLCFCGQQRHVWTKSPSTKRLLGEKPRDTPPYGALPYKQSIIPILSDPSPLLFSSQHPTSELPVTVPHSTLQISPLLCLRLGLTLDSNSDQMWQQSHKAILSGSLIDIRTVHLCSSGLTTRTFTIFDCYTSLPIYVKGSHYIIRYNIFRIKICILKQNYFY